MLKIGVEKLYQAKFINMDIEKVGNNLIPIIRFRKIYELNYKSKSNRFRQKFISKYEKIRYSKEFLKLGKINKNNIIIFTAKITDFKKAKSGNKHFKFTNMHNAMFKNKDNVDSNFFPNNIDSLVGMIIKKKYDNESMVKKINTKKYQKAYSNFINEFKNNI
ncbi:hypothetical protein [Apilactobacillus timberlakei]|uniref:Initiator Rep protein domain-containing protein n=1 Tax=Apilactobacillus timberlakei TaxID=2008380 RepID=A0ABY2YRJ1_9LACO|nr:hypothetical protein [Apilactobacillus timberlakei]TPR12301.1 hypothetical protein DY048_07845 [Apilactobacillus timberlakei]TPR12904.1 hypothetical protein DY052_08950 [Apilactobacillus timberlakei]